MRSKIDKFVQRVKDARVSDSANTTRDWPCPCEPTCQNHGQAKPKCGTAHQNLAGIRGSFVTPRDSIVVECVFFLCLISDMMWHTCWNRKRAFESSNGKLQSKSQFIQLFGILRVRTRWPYALRVIAGMMIIVAIYVLPVIQLSLRDIIDDQIGATRYLRHVCILDCEDNRFSQNWLMTIDIVDDGRLRFCSTWV